MNKQTSRHSSTMRTTHFSNCHGWCTPPVHSRPHSGACWDTHTPPVNRMIDRCKNITFPQLRLRAVIKLTFIESVYIFVLDRLWFRYDFLWFYILTVCHHINQPRLVLVVKSCSKYRQETKRKL